ncbi:hypothetical protein FER63_23365 [Salmonella enterica]|nr:hypothetical protein [Salmonella enterica]
MENTDNKIVKMIDLQYENNLLKAENIALSRQNVTLKTVNASLEANNEILAGEATPLDCPRCVDRVAEPLERGLLIQQIKALSERNRDLESVILALANVVNNNTAKTNGGVYGTVVKSSIRNKADIDKSCLIPSLF